MAFTHTFTFGWSDALSSMSGTKAVTGGKNIYIDTTIPFADPATPVARDVDFYVAGLKSIYMVATKDTTVTFYQADGTTPVNVVTLTANIPYTWITGISVAGDYAADVALMKVVPNTTQNLDLKVRILVDDAAAATP